MRVITSRLRSCRDLFQIRAVTASEQSCLMLSLSFWRVAAVMRDYGMYEREQAPQSMPDKSKPE
jgi:hypothetical protein